MELYARVQQSAEVPRQSDSHGNATSGAFCCCGGWAVFAAVRTCFVLCRVRCESFFVNYESWVLVAAGIGRVSGVEAG